MATLDQIAALNKNVTYNCELLKLTAKDGTVAAYAFTSRPIVFGGVTYQPARGEITQPVISIGLDEANYFDFTLPFDELITKTNRRRWRGAAARRETLVDYRDTTLGSIDIMTGSIGALTPEGASFTAEFRSLAAKYDQAIGELTGPTDRRARLDEVVADITPYKKNGTVKQVTSNRKFKINYVQPSANYFRYGLVQWQGGAKDGLEMEIKSSTTTDSGTRTEIELQEGMEDSVAVDDVAYFIMGYDGSLDAAVLLGDEAVESLQSEPHVPAGSIILTYPDA